MRKIILDTNFLMIPQSLNVDIFSEFERVCDFAYSIHILDKTIGEIDNIIKSQSLKHRKSAKLAKKIIETHDISIIDTYNDMYVDDILVDYAKSDPETIIATQDKELKERLKRSGIPVIMLRQKKYLVMEK